MMLQRTSRLEASPSESSSRPRLVSLYGRHRSFAVQIVDKAAAIHALNEAQVEETFRRYFACGWILSCDLTDHQLHAFYRRIRFGGEDSLRVRHPALLHGLDICAF